MECRTRPEITEDKVKQIRNVIAENPKWNRTKISKHICRINLPAAQSPSRTCGSSDKINHLKHDTTPIGAKLCELRPLHISTVNTRKIRDDWQHKYGHPVYCLET